MRVSATRANVVGTLFVVDIEAVSDLRVQLRLFGLLQERTKNGRRTATHTGAFLLHL